MPPKGPGPVCGSKRVSPSFAQRNKGGGSAKRDGRRGSDKRLLSACYLGNLDSIRATPVRTAVLEARKFFIRTKKKEEEIG